MFKNKYLKNLSVIEFINLCFLSLLLLISLFMFIFNLNPNIIYGILTYTLLMGLIGIINYLKYKNKLKGHIYNFIYLFYIPIVFDSMRYIVPYLFSPADKFLVAVENFILLGFNPSVFFQHTLSQNSLFNTILVISYVIYFFLPLTVITYHYLRKEKKELLHDVFYITLGLYLCYMGYILVPAYGPRFYYHYDTNLAGEKVFNFLISLMNVGEKNKLDAFPSAHVQMALVVLYLIRKNKTMFNIFFIEFIGILLSTIFLRYHYIVDILASFVFFYITIKLGNKLEKSFSK